MAPRGDRETTSDHPGKNLAGGSEEDDIWKERHAVGAGGREESGLGSRNAGTEMGDSQVG